MHRTSVFVLRRCLVALLSVLAIGCGDDDGGTGPAAPPAPTHYDLTLSMSSIDAVEDCESAGNSPGEFRYRLIVRKPDEFDNQLVVHDTGYQEVSISSGNRAGIVMDDIRFRVPNDPQTQFQVEYWIGERDGSAMQFEKHSWETHRLDSGRGQTWAAGRSYESDRYQEDEWGAGSGLYKFEVWNESSLCKGAAYYHVTWTPVVVE